MRITLGTMGCGRVHTDWIWQGICTVGRYISTFCYIIGTVPKKVPDVDRRALECDISSPDAGAGEVAVGFALAN